MTDEKITAIRELLQAEDVEGFIAPSTDEFQSEFTPKHARRLEFLTGFTGSYGVAIILRNKAAFFTDGRYTIQAKQQVNGFELYNIADKKPWEWAAEEVGGGAIGIDPWLHNEDNYAKYQNVRNLVRNPIDQIWEDRPLPIKSQVEVHDLQYSGEESSDKITTICADMQQNNIDACLLTTPDCVCWLLNIRAHDASNSPLLLAFAILYSDGKLDLFIEQNRISNEVLEHLGRNVSIKNPGDLGSCLEKLGGKTVSADPTATPHWFFEKLGKNEITREQNPCILPKSCKNPSEIEGAKQAHIKDGVAVTKFLYWIQNRNESIDEVTIDQKLLEFRKQDESFVEPSFDTIAGFGANGAIVHYRAEQDSCKKIDCDGILLVDSGGQYPCGTTDITRTIAIGAATSEQKRNFTLVLKGHIALASARFEKGTTGSELDPLARQFLQEAGLDYDHGTGHGVGSYLNVHEGPQRISKLKSEVALAPGMIISNEPGYYKAGAYGIRIESLIVVVEQGDEYAFETITKAPIDRNLIDWKIMTEAEKKWLENYHENVLKDLKPLLSDNINKWLQKTL